MAVHTSHSQPSSKLYNCHNATISRPAQGPQRQSQQQLQQQHFVNADGVLSSKTQPKAGSMLEATQAWFMNPAFGNQSPMPSPEKQPRRHPPPQPHPGTCTGVGGPSGHCPTGQGGQYSGLSAAPAAASWGQTSPIQQRAAASSRSAYDLQNVHGFAQEPHLQPTASRTAPLYTQATRHQQASQTGPMSSAQGPKNSEGAAEAAWSSAYQQYAAHASSDAVQSPAHSLHQRHGFPTLPAFQQQQQQALPAAWQHVADPAHDESQVQPRSLRQQFPQHAQQASQHTQHAHSSPPLAAAHAQQQDHAQQAWHQQHQQELYPHSSTQDQVHQLRGQQQDLKLSSGDDRMSDYVKKLQERLAAAEEQAAHARIEGDCRAQTLEARITVLEGRVRFVEGEWQLL